jgi:hypothetical protein
MAGADRETLQDLVLTRLQQLGDRTGPMPAREAARRSGDRVSYETIRKIARGAHSGRIGDEVAEGLARALDVPVARVYAAAEMQDPGAPWHWPARFNRLAPSERQLVEDVAAALLGAYARGRRDVG